MEGPSRNVPGRGPGNHAAAWSHRLSLLVCTQLSKHPRPCFSQRALRPLDSWGLPSWEQGARPEALVLPCHPSQPFKKAVQAMATGPQVHTCSCTHVRSHISTTRDVFPQAHAYSHCSLTLIHTHINTRLHAHTRVHNTQTCRVIITIVGWIVSLKRYVDIFAPVPVNVTLVGNRVSVDVIKMISNWIRVGP